MKLKFLFIIVFLSACSDIDLSEDFEVETSDVVVAVPLFHSNLTIPAISEASNVDGNIEILEDGTVQVNYRGDVIRQTSIQIFPPFPGIQDFPITDTLFSLPLPIEDSDIIDKAVIGRTNIDFFFETELEDIITIDLYLPQLSLDGNSFHRTFVIDNSDGNSNGLRSEQISIEEHTFIPDGNSLLFRYDARTSSGERIILEDARMGFDIFTFKYVEGRFGFRTFDVRGDIITIDIFNNWVSGGIIFRDPRVTLEVENAFGLLTKSKFNRMDIITVEGENLQLESPLLLEGIDFDFPGFDEIGKAIVTRVEFNSTNSNIKELFQRKASKVSYDIDALINSEDPDFKGFLTDTSYFNIQVEVNLPIEGTVSNLVLEETTEIDFSIYDDIGEMELKFDIDNTYPLDIGLQAYFEDDSGVVLDSLFVESLLKIEGAPLNELGVVTEGKKLQTTTLIDSGKVDELLSASAIRISARFDTRKYSRVVRLLKDYSLDINVGAKIKVE